MDKHKQNIFYKNLPNTLAQIKIKNKQSNQQPYHLKNKLGNNFEIYKLKLNSLKIVTKSSAAQSQLSQTQNLGSFKQDKQNRAKSCIQNYKWNYSQINHFENLKKKQRIRVIITNKAKQKQDILEQVIKIMPKKIIIQSNKGKRAQSAQAILNKINENRFDSYQNTQIAQQTEIHQKSISIFSGNEPSQIFSQRSQFSLNKNFFPSKWLAQRPDFIKIKKNFDQIKFNEEKERKIKIFAKKFYDRAIGDNDEIIKWLSSCLFFSIFPSFVLEAISKKIELKIYEKDDILCRIGDIGTCIFIILFGQIEIYINNVRIAITKEREILGRQALEGGTVRNATLKAGCQSHILILEKEDYQNILQEYLKKEREQYFYFLLDIPIFKQFGHRTIQQMSNSLFSRFVYTGDIIYKEGDSASTFFIIKSGEILSQRSFEISYYHRVPASNNTWSINRISKCINYSTLLLAGDFFGENEILIDSPRIHTILVKKDAQLLCINQKEFFQIFSSSELLFLRKNYNSKKENQIEKDQQQVQQEEKQEKLIKTTFMEAINEEFQKSLTCNVQTLFQKLQPWIVKNKNEYKKFLQKQQIKQRLIQQHIVDHTSFNYNIEKLNWKQYWQKDEVTYQPKLHMLFALIRLYQIANTYYYVLEDVLGRVFTQIFIKNNSLKEELKSSNDLIEIVNINSIKNLRIIQKENFRNIFFEYLISKKGLTNALQYLSKNLYLTLNHKINKICDPTFDFEAKYEDFWQKTTIQENYKQVERFFV